MNFPKLNLQATLLTILSLSFGLLSGWGMAHWLANSSDVQNTIVESPLDSNPAKIWSDSDDAPLNSSVPVLPTVGHADDAEILWSQIEASNSSPKRIDVPDDAAPLPLQ